MEDLLKLLNDKQREAVEALEGPVLVLAGAGSGKTRVLTYRVANLVSKGVRPSSILAVTFTNKAAKEIIERLKKICSDSHTLWAGTFHSICVRMLRERGEEIGISKRFTIYDEYAQSQCIKQAVENLKYDTSKYNPKKVLYEISDAKEKMISPEKYDAVYNKIDSVQIGRIYAEYMRLCKQNQALDFDDLINYGVELLEKSEKAREHYQKKFKYVHVDEFQDINTSQYKLISLLSEPQNNIFCVGDDDQSIYGWRGADIRFILEFRKNYPNCKVIKLEQNYRSTQNILNAAYEVVKKNISRNKKTIWTDNEVGETIELLEAHDNIHEAQLVEESIREKVFSGDYTYSDIAILYRANSLSNQFESKFMSDGIPYEIYGGLKFYERKEIKDILAYLQTINNVFDDFSLRRIINTPARGIGETTIERVKDFATLNGICLFDALERVDEIESVKKAARDKIKSFVKLMNLVRKEAETFPVEQIINSVLDYFGYKEMIRGLNYSESEERMSNIEELKNVAHNYAVNNETPSLGDFLQNISLQSDVDNIGNDQGKVMLMTVHASKGLEFPIVYVVGLEDGVFPHERSMGNSFEMEEERRLMYVAMTRAKKQLILSYAGLRQRNGQYKASAKSMFINDIPKNYFTDSKTEYETVETLEDIKNRVCTRKVVKQSYSPGNKLKHAVYGSGMVLNCQGEGDNEIVTIIFDDKRYGMRKFYVNKNSFERL